MKEITEETIKACRECAEKSYTIGDFYCSEAVIKSVLDATEIDYPAQAVAMASGFPVGIGGAGCVCGALSGGVMALGYLYGRTEGGSPIVEKAMALSNKLHNTFVQRNRTTCCRALTRGMVKGSPDHMKQCIRFTGEVAEDVMRIIAQIENKK